MYQRGMYDGGEGVAPRHVAAASAKPPERKPQLTTLRWRTTPRTALEDE
jgi:hypothetical protein